jgi:antitoxin CptB
MTDNLENLRGRLKFRSWHRGTKEMDLLMGHFADRHLDDYGAEELHLYAAILELPDPDVYDWIVGRSPLPAEQRNKVIEQLLAFRLADHLQ